MDSLGGWSHSGENISVDFTDLLSQLMLHNGAPFFDVVIDINLVNHSRYSLVVGLPKTEALVSSYMSTETQFKTIFRKVSHIHTLI